MESCRRGSKNLFRPKAMKKFSVMFIMHLRLKKMCEVTKTLILPYPDDEEEEGWREGSDGVRVRAHHLEYALAAVVVAMTTTFVGPSRPKAFLTLNKILP